MKINDIEQFMIDVGIISNHYQEIARITGGEFNIFKTLGLQTSETRLHSAILTDLLNPSGSHGQGDLFLKIFIEQHDIKDFDTKSAVAEYEKYIGFINSDYLEGGRIDILITDSKNKHIIIENKIYARDQENQLLRYYNFDKMADLFYLNLFGNLPTEFSTNATLSEAQYRIISYSYDILVWLEECKREAVSLPIIRETIAQYINLLKQLTNQTTEKRMKEEIKKLLVSKVNYIDSIAECWNVIQSTINETKTQFNELFNKLFPRKLIYSENDISIDVHWSEDSDGIFFSYQAIKNDKNVSNDECARKYVNILKEIDNCIYSNKWHIAWFNPRPIKRYQKFEHLDKKEIFKMNENPKELENFINNLIRYENGIRKEFLNRLEK